MVIFSLGLDDRLVDNGLTSDFGTMFDWEQQRTTLHSSDSTIPAWRRFVMSTIQET